MAISRIIFKGEDMEKRQEEILKILRKSEKPVKGEYLGEKLGVTRQVIVHDIALLRAQGVGVLATNRGYLFPKEQSGLLKKIVVQHTKTEDMEKELQIMVDHGAIVKDTIVDHPFYGELRGLLEIQNRKDIEDFIQEVREHGAVPLSKLTEGIHIHTLEVEDEETFEKIKKELKATGYLTN